jgi:hypothetical protein
VGQNNFSGLPENAENIVSPLLYPFVDVLCFAYHDSSDIENIIHHLNGSINSRKASATHCVLPEILIILTKEGVRQAQASEELLTNLPCSTLDLVLDYFSGLRFVKIKKDQLMSRKGYACLHSHLRKASERVRRRRVEQSMLFSATHLMAFTEIAFGQLMCTEPFNFIKASRILNPVAANLAYHMTNFVNQVKSAKELRTFAAETIASSLLLDHYPPGMHGMCALSQREHSLTFVQRLSPVMSSIRFTGIYAHWLRDRLFGLTARMDTSYRARL